MAAAASSSSNSVSNSEPSTNHSTIVKDEQPQGLALGDLQDAPSEIMGSNEVKKEVEDSKEVKRESMEEPTHIMDKKEHIEKFKKYEAEFKQYLMSKYFSDKTIFGGNIFDVKMNIDGQTIAASRLPPYQSYLDPATFDELISKGSSSPSSTTSNGKPST